MIAAICAKVRRALNEWCHEPHREGLVMDRADLILERQLANARVGYQVAVSLWVYEGNLIWSKFNALLVAQSIVLAAVGLALTAANQHPLLAKAMPLAGLMLCALWFLLVKRGFDNYIYWIRSARELEEQYLADPVKTVARGGAFADGCEVTHQIGGRVLTLHMAPISQLFNAEKTSYGVVLVFAVVYLVLGSKSWGWW